MYKINRMGGGLGVQKSFPRTDPWDLVLHTLTFCIGESYSCNLLGVDIETGWRSKMSPHNKDCLCRNVKVRQDVRDAIREVSCLNSFMLPTHDSGRPTKVSSESR